MGEGKKSRKGTVSWLLYIFLGKDLIRKKTSGKSIVEGGRIVEEKMVGKSTRIRAGHVYNAWLERSCGEKTGSAKKN